MAKLRARLRLRSVRRCEWGYWTIHKKMGQRGGQRDQVVEMAPNRSRAPYGLALAVGL